jgi:DNA-binding SARP family transcriptional activator
LLTEPNEIVSTDRLGDALWGDAGPGEGAAALAKVVYRLRAALTAAGASDVLLTQAPGYRLVVAAEQIDAGRFADLVQHGQDVLDEDPGRALAVLDEALALWRGQAWGELADVEAARPLVARLDGLHAVAVECRVEALLGLDRYEVAIRELDQAIAKYPLRERPRGQ